MHNNNEGAIVVMIVQLHILSMSITTIVLSSNPAHGEV